MRKAPPIVRPTIRGIAKKPNEHIQSEENGRVAGTAFLAPR